MPAVPRELVVIDTETTGLDPGRDRVIEIGAARLDATLGVTATWSTLVDPGCALPLQVQRLTGITPDDLAGAPSFAAAYEQLLAFAGDAVVVGQNVAFDLAMLGSAAARCGAPPPPSRSFDTLQASLLLLPEADRHGLGALARAARPGRDAAPGPRRRARHGRPAGRAARARRGALGDRAPPAPRGCLAAARASRGLRARALSCAPCTPRRGVRARFPGARGRGRRPPGHPCLRRRGLARRLRARRRARGSPPGLRRATRPDRPGRRGGHPPLNWRHRPVRGRHRHGQEPRLPAAGRLSAPPPAALESPSAPRPRPCSASSPSASSPWSRAACPRGFAGRCSWAARTTSAGAGSTRR